MSIQKSKITLTSFRPKRIAAEADEVRKLLLGTLIGRANGTVERVSPSGDQKYVGLGGRFEANIVGDNQPVQSGVLFMPETFQSGLVEMLSDKIDSKTGEILEHGADAVNIAFRVYVVRDGNAQGYAWELESIVDPTAEAEVDPLSDLRKLMMSAPKLVAIEDGSETDEGGSKKRVKK